MSTVLNDYQLERKAEAQRLADLLAPFCNTHVEQSTNDSFTFDVIVEHNGERLRAFKQWRGGIDFDTIPYERYDHISSEQRSKVYKSYQLCNMNVPTQKKVLERITNAIKARDELRELERKAIDTTAQFIAEFERVAKELGVTPQYNYHQEYSSTTGAYIQKDIRRGELKKNGITFEFELCTDGYISKKLSLYYAVPSTLEAFKALSTNQYQHVTAQ